MRDEALIYTRGNEYVSYITTPLGRSEPVSSSALSPPASSTF
jgi:hypothetical protein